MPTTCATSAPPPPSAALRRTTCSAAFPDLALTSFPQRWTQTHGSGRRPPAPIPSRVPVLDLYAPAARRTPSPAAFTVRRPRLPPVTRSCRTTLCSTRRKAASLLQGRPTQTRPWMEMPQRKLSHRNSTHPKAPTPSPPHSLAPSDRSGREVMSHLKKRRERWTAKWSFQGDRDRIAA